MWQYQTEYWRVYGYIRFTKFKKLSLMELWIMYCSNYKKLKNSQKIQRNGVNMRYIKKPYAVKIETVEIENKNIYLSR